MAVSITQKEIDELLKEIELSFKLPSIIDITPTEISLIRDDATRRDMQRKFHLINELFIAPLEKLLTEAITSVNREGYSCNYSPYSLKQRMRLISKDLLIYGYKPSYLCTLLPTTVEEVNRRVKEIEEHRDFQVIDSKKINSSHRKIA